MTVRDLIKELEACSLDKQVVLVVSVLGSTEEGVNLLLKEVGQIIENNDFVGIQ